MEVVVQPHRIEAGALGRLGNPSHCLVLLGRIGDLGEIHPPALRHEHAKANRSLGRGHELQLTARMQLELELIA